MEDSLAVRLDFNEKGLETLQEPSFRGSNSPSEFENSRDNGPIDGSLRNKSPVKVVSFRLDMSAVEAAVIEKVATPSPIPVKTDPGPSSSEILMQTRSSQRGAEESKRMSSRIDQIASSSQRSFSPSQSKRFSEDARKQVISTRRSIRKEGSTMDVVEKSRKREESRLAASGKGEVGAGPVLSSRQSNRAFIGSPQGKSQRASPPRSHAAVTTGHSGAEEAPLPVLVDDMLIIPSHADHASVVSGKLSPSIPLSSPPAKTKASGKKLGEDEEEKQENEEKMQKDKTETVGTLRGLYDHVQKYFFGPATDPGPGPFSLESSVPPPISTKRVVLLGQDDAAKAYLQRKLLCTTGYTVGAQQCSHIGVRVASKMSNTGECAFVEITDIPLQELEEELESENSYVLQKILPRANAIIMVFDANDCDVMGFTDDEDGGYSMASCPSLVYLQDLYDRLVIDEILAPNTTKLIVGNVGLAHKLSVATLPQQTIRTAEEWAFNHEDEGLFYTTLALGNDRDINIVRNLLNVNL